MKPWSTFNIVLLYSTLSKSCAESCAAVFTLCSARFLWSSKTCLWMSRSPSQCCFSSLICSRRPWTSSCWCCSVPSSLCATEQYDLYEIYHCMHVNENHESWVKSWLTWIWASRRLFSASCLCSWFCKRLRVDSRTLDRLPVVLRCSCHHKTPS